jgi:peroxiredoxin
MMTAKRTILFSLLSVILVSSFTFLQPVTVNDFSLRNTDGKMVSLKDYPDAKGFIVVFTCNHCPFAKLYPERLNQLNTTFKSKDVPLIAISSTDTSQYEEDRFPVMVERSEKGKYNFPYLYDAEQSVAKAFNADKTPHAFVIWKKGNKWQVKYSGAIDDNGASPGKVKNRYVQQAVEALLEGKEPPVEETKSIGCQIYYRGKN